MHSLKEQMIAEFKLRGYSWGARFNRQARLMEYGVMHAMGTVI
jgi:hypothetical protein